MRYQATRPGPRWLRSSFSKATALYPSVGRLESHFSRVSLSVTIAAGANHREGLIKYDSARMLLVVDLLGTFVFAVEGAIAGIAANLDLLGLTVVAFSTALSGGIIRDLLIGAIPPNSIRDWRYPTVAFVGGAVAFCSYQLVSQPAYPISRLAAICPLLSELRTHAGPASMNRSIRRSVNDFRFCCLRQR